MAKDDYHTIVFKVLVYLYAVYKRKIVFENDSFYHATGYKYIHEGCFINTLYFMKQDGLIDDISISRAWGNEYILCSDLSYMTITPQGISYLEENKKMRKIKDYFMNNVDIISSLISMIW